MTDFMRDETVPQSAPRVPLRHVCALYVAPVVGGGSRSLGFLLMATLVMGGVVPLRMACHIRLSHCRSTCQVVNKKRQPFGRAFVCVEEKALVYTGGR